MARRKRLDAISVPHPLTGEVLRVLPMDDGHCDIDIVPGRAWAVFNLRSGVKDGTRFGLTTVERPEENEEDES
jgi:hypothetical protein